MRLRIRICSLADGGSATSEIVEIKKDSCTLGRAGADLTINDNGASRRHAMFYQGLRGELRVMDLHSTNGTYLGEEKIIDHPLGHGSIIRVADTAITILDYEPDRQSFGANLSTQNLSRANEETTEVAVLFKGTKEAQGARAGNYSGTSRRVIAQPNPLRKIG